MYKRATPKRQIKSVAEIREEAAAKLRAERERKKVEAEEKRRPATKEKGSNMPGSNKKVKKTSLTGSGIPVPPASSQSQQQSQNQEQPQPPPQQTSTTEPSTEEKQPDPSFGMDPGQLAFLMAMESRIKKHAENSAGKVSDLLQRNIERIDNNAKSLLELKTRETGLEERLIKKIEERDEVRELNLEKRLTNIMDRKIEAALTSRIPPAGVGAASVPQVSAMSTRREAAYDLCRRALRIWPIKGPDLQASLRSFLTDNLKIPENTMSTLGPVEIKSFDVGRDAVDRGAVVATFESRETRDFVKSHGRHLAGQSEAGMNIHVPGFLLDNLHTLNAVGYSIKSKHQNVKRIIKYDDPNSDLVLDICIANEWKRITPGEARGVADLIPEKRSTGRKLTKADLSSLVLEEPVAGLTATVVVDEDNE